LDSNLHWIADHDENRIRRSCYAFVGDPSEDRKIGFRQVAPVLHLGGCRRACSDHDDIGRKIREIGNDINMDSPIVEGIEQIYLEREQAPLGGRLAMADQQYAIIWFEQIFAKQLRREHAADHARGAENSNSRWHGTRSFRSRPTDAVPLPWPARAAPIIR
jgi:hypothetical protein